MPYLGETAALITALLWGLTSIAFTEASLRVGSLTVNITRLVFATILLSVTILIMQLDIHLSYEQIFFLGMSGIIGLVFGDGFLFAGFQYVGARISMLVMSLVPPISTLLAFIFLGEIVSIWSILGIFLTLFGILVVVIQKQVDPKFQAKNKTKGIFYCFLGALGQAVALIFAKNAFNDGEINGFVATWYRIIPSLILFYPMAYFFGKIKNPIRVFKKDKTALKHVMFGSIVGPYLGITFSLIAIANTFVGIASTLIATTPIIMLPMVVLYYKEKLSIVSIIGTVIAVAGVAILFLK